MEEYCFQLFKPLFCYYFGPLLLKYISRPLSLIFFIYVEGICVATFFCISGKEHSRSLLFLTLLTQSEERLCLSYVLSLPTHIHNLSLNRRVVIERLYLNLFPIFLLFLGLMSFLLCANGKEIKSASGLLYFLSVSYLKLYMLCSVVTNFVSLLLFGWLLPFFREGQPSCGSERLVLCWSMKLTSWCFILLIWYKLLLHSVSDYSCLVITKNKWLLIDMISSYSERSPYKDEPCSSIWLCWQCLSGHSWLTQG